MFEECDNIEGIEQINQEFPFYHKVKIKDGFLMIFFKDLEFLKLWREKFIT